jgi:hypothetical protein
MSTSISSLPGGGNNSQFVNDQQRHAAQNFAMPVNTSGDGGEAALDDPVIQEALGFVTGSQPQQQQQIQQQQQQQLYQQQLYQQQQIAMQQQQQIQQLHQSQAQQTIVSAKAPSSETFWIKLLSSVLTQDMIILGAVCFVAYLVVSHVPVDVLADKLNLSFLVTSQGDLVSRAIILAVSVVAIKGFVL